MNDIDPNLVLAAVGLTAAAFILHRLLTTGSAAAEQAGEGASIIWDWLDEPVSDIWRDATREGAQLTPGAYSDVQALERRFGPNWGERDPAELRAYLESIGRR